jgi:tetraacyldisaccharide 4'-kinase
LGINAQTHAFPDHHCYSETDISLNDADAILMTEKDAVKCASFATEQCWVLRVDAQVDPTLAQHIIEKIKK